VRRLQRVALVHEAVVWVRDNRAQKGEFNDHVGLGWLRKGGEVGVILKYGDVAWEEFVGIWDED